jgi:hypothetical protein
MTKVKGHNLHSKDSNDRDANLAAFLQQYAPPVPEASAGAEDRLMAAIASSSRTVTHPESAAHQESTSQARPVKTAHTASGNRFWRSRLIVATGCSVLIYALWQIYQVVIPTHHPVGELAEIETFWFQNWDGVANAEDTSPFLTESDSSLDSATGESPKNFNRPPS